MQEKRLELKQRTFILQDSRKSVTKKINEFPIQEVSEPVAAYAIEGVVLKKERKEKGEEVLSIKENSTI